MVKERKQFAQNKAQIFNRGKRLKFPIGIQPVKQQSADQRETAKSSETKLLEAFRNLNETLRGVVMGDHAKDANQPDVTSPATQNTSNHGGSSARSTASASFGVDTEDADVSMTPTELFTPTSKASVVSRRSESLSQMSPDALNSGSGQHTLGTHDHTASSQKMPASQTPQSAGSLPQHYPERSNFVPTFSTNPLQAANDTLRAGERLVTDGVQRTAEKSAVAKHTRSRTSQIPVRLRTPKLPSIPVGAMVRVTTGAVRIPNPTERQNKI